MYLCQLTLAFAYLFVFFLAPAFSLQISSASCPVRVRPSPKSVHQTAPRCECNHPLAEVHCHDLYAVPEFLPSAERQLFFGLYMARQHISSLEPETFVHLRVRKIVLDFNPIGDRIHPESFAVVERFLRELHLGACGIRNLPTRLLQNLTQLEYLYLWGNRLEIIPSDFFRGAGKLRELVLWGNHLDTIEDGAFNGLGQLRRLDLEQNRIEDHAITNSPFRPLANLEVLHLGRNRISSITSEGIFVGMVRLRVLTLDRNGLRFIYPKAFDSLSSLSSLSLSHNLLYVLPDVVFTNLSRLVVLNLQDNQLQHPWPKTFTGLRSLHVLYLSRNRISSLTGEVFGDSPDLRHIFLDGNFLKTLGQCVLPYQPRLKTLALTGNPIHCDCKLLWMRSFFRKHLEMSVTGSCAGQLVSVVSSVLSMTTDRSNGGCTLPIPVQECKSLTS